MTLYPRFQPIPDSPYHAYWSYDRAAVDNAFALTDWWLERKRWQSAATVRRTVPFALTLLAAIDSSIALSADAPRDTVCGGDYVCVADASTPVPAAMRVEPKHADHNRCAEGAIDVVASSAEERAFACVAAADALRLLSHCGIAPRWSLNVEIMPEVRHPLGRVVLGLLDTRRKRALITQESNAYALIKETPYAALPRRAFYRSLIVHEVVHAVVDQNLKRAASTHAAYEYPAYALQIESLAPEHRDIFLSSFDQTALRSDALFNDPVLFLDPYLFAARAYSHFKRSLDGCAYLNGLLEGSAPFIISLDMQ
jgi:hypothetical protein